MTNIPGPQLPGTQTMGQGPEISQDWLAHAFHPWLLSQHRKTYALYQPHQRSYFFLNFPNVLPQKKEPPSYHLQEYAY